jgi:hypothetical protein
MKKKKVFSLSRSLSHQVDERRERRLIAAAVELAGERQRRLVAVLEQRSLHSELNAPLVAREPLTTQRVRRLGVRRRRRGRVGRRRGRLGCRRVAGELELRQRARAGLGGGRRGGRGHGDEKNNKRDHPWSINESVSKSEKKKKKNGKKIIFFLFSLKNTKVTALSVRCLRVFSLSLSRPVPSLRHRRSGAASSRAVKRVEKRKK